jgi:4-amino-4-deoxy-L-arabinose transferase-like glycosyltransferase
MIANKIQSFLSWYYVYLLEINFLLLITALAFSFKYIKKIFSEIQNKHLLLLVLIAILGVFSTSLLAPRVHRLYYDEDIYNDIAQNIAYNKQAVMSNEGHYENNTLQTVEKEYNKQPPGYPYLISVIFRIFGINELFTFILNNIIFGLTVIVIFLISFLLFKDIFASFISCLSFILIPVNLQWHNTCAVEPATAFFTSLAVLAALLYIKFKKPVILFFVVTSLAFSLSFRTESYLVAVLIFFIFLIKEPRVFKRKELYAFAGLFLFLSTAILLHLYSVRGQSWGAQGAKISLDYFRNNSFTNTVFYFNNKHFPLLLSIFATLGLFSYKVKEKFKDKLVLFVWFLIFWGIFLIFYAGSYRFGQDVRFSILSYVPISIFVGIGISYISNLLENKIKPIKGILFFLIIFNSTWFLPFIKAEGEEAWAARNDHKRAVEFAELLPINSIVYTHTPNIFLLNKKSALQSSSATYRSGSIEQNLYRFKGGVYVHHGYWSNVNDPQQRSFTQNILNKYNYETIKEYYYRNYKYGLYKILNRREEPPNQ